MKPSIKVFIGFVIFTGAYLFLSIPEFVLNIIEPKKRNDGELK